MTNQETAVSREDVAWDWMDGKFLNVEAGHDPNDRTYDADEMVDAFIAGMEATRQQASPGEGVACEVCQNPDLCAGGKTPCDLSGEFHWPVDPVVANKLLAASRPVAQSEVAAAVERLKQIDDFFNAAGHVQWSTDLRLVLASLKPAPDRGAIEAAERERCAKVARWGRVELEPFVHDAAIAWCGEKDRETFPEDITYFRANWYTMTGLRAMVVATAIRALPALAQGEGEDG